MNDFVVDTRGHCFLCLNYLQPTSSIELKSDFDSTSSSIQNLSRFLKLDMKKVFIGTGSSIPPDLLAMVEQSHLKVKLCEDCTSLSKRFSKLYRQLEKIQMDVTSCVKLIHGKVAKVRHLQNNTIEPSSLEEGRLLIMEALRAEAFEKCARKIKADPPNIRLERMSVKKIVRQQRKFKSAALSTAIKKNVAGQEPGYPPNPDNNVKMEFVDSPPRDDDYMNDLSDTEMPEMDADKLQLPQRFPTLEENKVAKKRAVGKPTASTGFLRCFTMIRQRQQGTQEQSLSLPKPSSVKSRCSHCGKGFVGPRSLERHLKSAHLNLMITAEHACDLCTETFESQAGLKLHQRTVHVGDLMKMTALDLGFLRKK